MSDEQSENTYRKVMAKLVEQITTLHASALGSIIETSEGESTKPGCYTGVYPFYLKQSVSQTDYKLEIVPHGDMESLTFKLTWDGKEHTFTADVSVAMQWKMFSLEALAMAYQISSSIDVMGGKTSDRKYTFEKKINTFREFVKEIDPTRMKSLLKDIEASKIHEDTEVCV